MYHEPDFEPTRDEMYRILEENIPWSGRIEQLSIWEADGRVAAGELFAEYSLPNQPASAFDGIAVRFGDFAAGMPDTAAWAEGRDYAFSNTGVAIPREFDTVVAIEEVVRQEDGSIRLLSRPEERGSNVAAAGSQLRRGECLVHRGEKLHPALLGVLAAAGYRSVPVYARATVLFLPTGDELVPFGGTVPEGKNVESNSVMLAAMMARCGASPAVSPILADDPARLRKAILDGIRQAELVVIGAGSSKGSKDFTMDVLEEIGTVVVQELGVAPGKHCSLTMVEGRPVMGIPGPPGGAQLICGYYIKAAIELIMSGSISGVPGVPAILTEAIPRRPIDFMHPVRLSVREGSLYARPCAVSGRTRAESRNDQLCICYCPKGVEYQAGDTVTAELPLGRIFPLPT